MALITLVNGSSSEVCNSGYVRSLGTGILEASECQKSLLTQRFIAITLNKGMNAHAF